MRTVMLCVLTLACGTVLAAEVPQTQGENAPMKTPETCDTTSGGCSSEHWKKLSNEEWRQKLTPEQYRIAREAGTERAFTGKYWNTHTAGVYHCAACNLPLFSSTTKFDSGTGWPSFYAPLNDKAVTTVADRAHGMVRVEVRCGQCDAHLGHVFSDGPQPTGQRYCMNSAVLNLVEDKK